MAIPSLPIGPFGRRVLRVLGYIVLALVTFAFALQATFPYDRVKDRLVDGLSAKYDVTIGGVERGIMPGTVTFTAVSLRTRPTKPDEVPSVMFIKDLRVSVGLLALIGKTASVDIKAHIGTGTIEGNVQLSQKETVVDMTGSELPSASMPMREAIGLPMSGKIGFTAQLTLPIEKTRSGKIGQNWEKAVGSITFDCPSSCQIGDGEAKLKPKLKSQRNQAFAGDGIVVKLGVDSLSAKVDIKKGQLTLTKFEVKSKDIEAHIDFNMTLASNMDESLVAGCLRFKATDDLAKRESSTHSALTTTGATLGPDNLFHIRLDGTLKDMKRLAQHCGPSVSGVAIDGNEKERDRKPTVTVQPADETLKGVTHDASVAPAPIPPGPTNEDAKGSAMGSAPPPNNGAQQGSAPVPAEGKPINETPPTADGAANAGAEQVAEPPAPEQHEVQ